MGTEEYESEGSGRMMLVEILHAIWRTVDRGEASIVLSKLLALRRIRRDIKWNRIVEHPSRPDRESLIHRMLLERRDSEACRRWRQSSGEDFGLQATDMTNTDPDFATHTSDIQTLQAARQNAKAHDGSLDRLIGIVWASSKGTKLEPRYGKVDDIKWIREDWALIKLFPEVRDQVRNAFDTNILRRGQSAESFRRLKPWPIIEAYPVSKRGRTTDYTIGKVNGNIVAGRVNGSTQHTLEYTITPTGTNGLFSQSGDSGSWIMDKRGQLIGMLWGKSKGSTNTCFTPGQYFFTWIDRKFKEATGQNANAELSVNIVQ